MRTKAARRASEGDHCMTLDAAFFRLVEEVFRRSKIERCCMVEHNGIVG